MKYFLYTMLALSSISNNAHVDLLILGGTDCLNDTFDEDFNFKDNCKSSFAAQLVIDGKVVGSIPLDALSKEQIDNLRETIKSINKAALTKCN